MTKNILIAGFGGQGVLFTGKFIAYGALIEGKELSWLPSYGPEMRGGTANCTVILSDDPIGSPIVDHPNVVMVMNNPSLDKYDEHDQDRSCKCDPKPFISKKYRSSAMTSAAS